MSVNLFDVLKTINGEKETENELHAYFADNLKHINAGRNGWGDITIAITSEDAQKLLSGTLVGETICHVMLFVVGKKQYDATRAALELAPQQED